MARQSQYPVKRAEILSAIGRADRTRPKAPSVREIAEETELSVATLHNYLTRLAAEDLVEWLPRRHRSLRLTHHGRRMTQARDIPAPF